MDNELMLPSHRPSDPIHRLHHPCIPQNRSMDPTYINPYNQNQQPTIEIILTKILDVIRYHR